MPIPKKYSQDMNQLIENLLEKNPNIRPSIIDILNEDYIKRSYLFLKLFFVIIKVKKEHFLCCGYKFYVFFNNLK